MILGDDVRIVRVEDRRHADIGLSSMKSYMSRVPAAKVITDVPRLMVFFVFVALPAAISS